MANVWKTMKTFILPSTPAEMKNNITNATNSMINDINNTTTNNITINNNYNYYNCNHTL